MKKFKYVMIGALSSAVLATCIVAPTLAWLSSKSDEVVNTFDGGEIRVKMDEAKVDKDGKKLPSEPRVTENTYKFVAGSELDKDPTPTVLKGSISAYVFVNLKNDNPDVFSVDIQNKWAKVAQKDGQSLYVYKTKVDASNAEEDVKLDPLFTKVTVATTLTSEQLKTMKEVSDKQFIKTQTYAIQSQVIENNAAIDQAAAEFGYADTDVTYVTVG